VSDHDPVRKDPSFPLLSRWAFGVFAVALAIGTHWPALQIEASVSRPDLLIHVAAFGTWAMLLIMAAFFGPRFSTRNVLISAGVAIAYAGVDELTQGIPSLSRTVSMQDFLANVIGIGGATILAGIASLSIKQSGSLHGPLAWALSLVTGLIIGGLLTIVVPAEYVDVAPVVAPEHVAPSEATAHDDHPVIKPNIPLILCLPFALLLASIAIMPFVSGRLWHHHFPDFSFFLGGIVVGYYLIQFGTPYSHGMTYGAYYMLHSMLEYISFIALVGGLYVASGAILIDVRGRGRPLANTILLGLGALFANVVGTTGASMLLIRPFMRLNEGRLRAIHIVFFIFIVSNCGGALTPIGDPPLYLGFLKGIPFFWTLHHLWPMCLVCVASLLVTFFLVDSQIARKDGASPVPPEPFRLSVRGKIGAIGLAGIIAAVFIDPLLQARFESLKGVPIGPFVQIAIAVGVYLLASREIYKQNEFSFFPIKEVGLLFIGIFATMTPALGYLATHAEQIALHTPAAYYWATGSLSGMLDNAPTYATFLQLAYGSEPITREGLRVFVASDPGLEIVIAISLGAVFFGAFTYIGNGPNFMVKAIAEQAGVKMPSFFGYMLRSALFLAPSLFIIWAVFLR
jgi:Na+/H+ antiporter NhaD/arsenite permease-like protein